VDSFGEKSTFKPPSDYCTSSDQESLASSTLRIFMFKISGFPLIWDGCVGNDIEEKFIEEFQRCEEYSYAGGNIIIPDSGDSVLNLNSDEA